MDDINRQLQDARRAQALRDRAKLEQEEAEAPEDEAPRPPPSGAGRLTMARRQGEWRFYLCDQRIRVGEPLEFYVDARIGFARAAHRRARAGADRRGADAPALRVTDGDA